VIKVRPKALVPVVNVTSTVAFDTRKFAAVGARIPGRVRQIYKIVGDVVAPGEPLAEIESAELGRAEAMLIGARAKEKAAEAEMKRERELAEQRVSAAREAEAAKAAYEAIRAERIATERTVEALGGTMPASWATSSCAARSPGGWWTPRSRAARPSTPRSPRTRSRT
jgi:cobalt-zinc-cadmium efflux system membrane fusion protein